MITVLHRGGYAQMITILHRGGGSLGTPKSDYVICARPLIQKEASIIDAVRTNENADANQDDNRNYPDIL